MELLKCNFAAIVEKLRISPIIFLYTLGLSPKKWTQKMS